jgi:hypothetical protein
MRLYLMGGSLLLLKSIDLGKQKQCFRIAISLPLAAKSIAFGRWEHCFWALEALLLGAGSIAFGCWEALLLAVGASLLSLLSRFVPFVSFVPVVFFSLFVKIN